MVEKFSLMSNSYLSDKTAPDTRFALQGQISAGLRQRLTARPAPLATFQAWR
jgi:hypothetical protein